MLFSSLILFSTLISKHIWKSGKIEDLYSCLCGPCATSRENRKVLRKKGRFLGQLEGWAALEHTLFFFCFICVCLCVCTCTCNRGQGRVLSSLKLELPVNYELLDMDAGIWTGIFWKGSKSHLSSLQNINNLGPVEKEVTPLRVIHEALPSRPHFLSLLYKPQCGFVGSNYVPVVVDSLYLLLQYPSA